MERIDLNFEVVLEKVGGGAEVTLVGKVLELIEANTGLGKMVPGKYHFDYPTYYVLDNAAIPVETQHRARTLLTWCARASKVGNRLAESRFCFLLILSIR